MIRRGTTLAVFAAALAHSQSAWACAVCFDATAETRWAFLGTTIFLSLLPLATIGLIVLWLIRASRAAELADETRTGHGVLPAPDEA